MKSFLSSLRKIDLTDNTLSSHQNSKSIDLHLGRMNARGLQYDSPESSAVEQTNWHKFYRQFGVVSLLSTAAYLWQSTAVMAAPLSCSSIYADVYGGTAIYSINTTTAAITQAATLPVNSGIGIAITPGATPTLYSDIYRLTTSPPAYLNYTNGTTPGTSTTAKFTAPYGGGLGTTNNGLLFYIGRSGSTQSLMQFPTPTSAAVNLGTITAAIPGDPIWPTLSPGDMMSDANGRLYYFGTDYVKNNLGQYTNYLYYIDSSKSAHLLGSYLSTRAGIGVAFNPAGVMYTLNANLLYKIDMTAGFSSTLIGDTGNSNLIDMASCALPTMNPNVSGTKTVRDVTTSQNPATIVNTNDILEYNVVVTNTGNLPSDGSKFIDVIPPGSSYVGSSTKLCNATGVTCATVADVAGVGPFVGSGMLVNTSGQSAGVMLAGSANNAIVKFQVKVTSTGAGTTGNPISIVNTGQTSYPTVSGGTVTTSTPNTSSTSVPIAVPTDYSDAPSSYGSASHTIVSGIHLGTTITAESAAYNSPLADGDTDDGISSFPTLTAGATTYSIPAANIAATGTGTLHAWIDFNQNGTFEAGEHTSVAVTSNTLAGALNWTGITAGAAGNTFARFRFTSDSNVTANTPSGIAANGEVEDYQISIGAAPLTCGTIYGSYLNGGIYNGLRGYTPSTGSLATQIATLTTPGGTTTAVAALAVDPLLDSSGNRRVYYMENTGTGAKLYYYNGSSISDTGIALTVPYSPINIVRSDGSTGSLNNTFNRMGFAPDGTLYIADGQKTFYRFSPNRSGTGGILSSANTITDNTNNDSGNSGRAKVGQSGGGDIAFDNAGRMYIVTYDSNNSNVPTEFRLFQIFNPNSSTPTAVLLGKEPSTDTVAGLAFQASDNTLYMQGSGGKSFGWNLATNTVTPLTLAVPGSADLGSCTYPDLNPTGAFTKTVANITNPGATKLTANDVLEYTLNVTNNGNLVAGNVTLTDAIPAGTTYVAGSTKLNGTLKADNSGAMPYANTTTPQQINSPGKASGVLTAGASNKATVVFRVNVNASKTQVCNQGNVKYDGGLSVGIFSDDPTTTVADDQTCTGVNQANMLIVKRITAIKAAGATTATNYNTFDTTSPALGNDRNCNWPLTTNVDGACTNNYILGKIDAGLVKPGDEIEYTIYYLNAGANKAKQARICDRLNNNLTFQTQFDSTIPTTIDKGIALAQNSTSISSYLTNTGTDSDKGELTTENLVDTSCNLSANTTPNPTSVLPANVVVVDVTTPLLSGGYGYIRFKTTVK